MEGENSHINNGSKIYMKMDFTQISGFIKFLNLQKE